jgi:hypothetical protein
MDETALIPPSAMTDLSLLAEWTRIGSGADGTGRAAALAAELKRRNIDGPFQDQQASSSPSCSDDEASVRGGSEEPTSIDGAARQTPLSNVALGIRAALAPIRHCDQHRVAGL